ncbi:MAG: PEP-CTERM sorting domain-containing protein [Alphaproteobacteria bacterium]|nr:PEP-CTERM sorting domain-containing protein [Alphaproteobacteria bacterium]
MLHRVVFSIAAAFAIVAVGSATSFASNIIVVPEPASIALLAAGVGALAWVKFRRRD